MARAFERTARTPTKWLCALPNVHCATRYMNGAVAVEESVSPEKAVTGLFIYSFDMEKHQWALY